MTDTSDKFDISLMRAMTPVIRDLIKTAHVEGHSGDHVVTSLAAACVGAIGAAASEGLMRWVALEGFAVFARFWVDLAKDQ